MQITDLAPGVVVSSGPWTEVVQSVDAEAETVDLLVEEGLDHVDEVVTTALADLNGWSVFFTADQATASPEDLYTQCHSTCDQPTEEHPFTICGVIGGPGVPCPPLVDAEAIVARDFDYAYVWRFGRDENGDRVTARLWPPTCRTRPFP